MRTENSREDLNKNLDCRLSGLEIDRFILLWINTKIRRVSAPNNAENKYRDGILDIAEIATATNSAVSSPIGQKSDFTVIFIYSTNFVGNKGK
jgi:hypothetical protein